MKCTSLASNAFKQPLLSARRGKQHPSSIVPRAEPQEDISEEMKRDLERLRLAQEASKNRFAPIEKKEPPPPGPLDNFKDVMDKILIADFFFVLLIGAWLGVAVAVNETNPQVYEAWTSLWTPVFQPAIGILMAGALGSGAIGYVKDSLLKGGDKQ